MLLQSIIIGLIAVFMQLDSRVLGRLNFERPLITCTLVGLVMGDLETGLLIGAQLEMVTLGMMSIGASGFDMNKGAIVGCAIVIRSGVDIETALAIAVPLTVLDRFVVTFFDVVRLNLTHMIDRAVEASNYKKAKFVDIVLGPLTYCINAFAVVFIAVYFGEGLINQILEVVPEFIMTGVSLGANIISFYGFALLLSTMISKKNCVFFLIGFVISAYSGLGLTAIAVIGIVLALLFYQLRYGNGQAVAVGAVDELDELD